MRGKTFDEEDWADLERFAPRRTAPEARRRVGGSSLEWRATGAFGTGPHSRPAVEFRRTLGRRGGGADRGARVLTDGGIGYSVF